MPATSTSGLRPSSPALELLQRALLPTEREVAFLRACLLEGDGAATSWERWIALCGDPLRALREDRIGVKRHLPRLYANLAAADARQTGELGPYLRTAVAREKLRSQRFRSALAEALDALASVNVRPLLLRGTAIGETIVAEPWLRHSHDADLYVAAAELERARLALQGAGFQQRATPGSSSTLRLDHPNGLPICLHARLLDAPPAMLDEPQMLARAIEAVSSDRTVRSLCNEDSLVHVCCHAATHGSRRALGWVIDAVTLIRASRFDWTRIDAVAWESAGVLLAPALEVVDKIVPGIVPGDVLLRAPARSTQARGMRELCLRAAAVSMRARELLWRADGNADRAYVLALLIRRLPSQVEWRLRSAWEEKWLKTARRHRLLGPLRSAWLRLKPTLGRGIADARVDHPPTWRERDLS